MPGQEGQIKKMEHIFIFPPQDDDIKFTTAGTLEINFYSGEVKTRSGAKAEGGRLPALQKNLRGGQRESIRSLILRVDKKVRIYTDGDNKQLIPIEAGDLWRLEMLPFKILYINILSANTTLMTCMASTSLVGFIPTMHRTPSNGDTGVKTITAAGTAEQITEDDTPIQTVRIKAIRTNTDDIYFSFSEAHANSTSGDRLAPNEAVSINIDNLNKIWLDAAVNGEGVTYSYVY
jgi:hypothetical protein